MVPGSRSRRASTRSSTGSRSTARPSCSAGWPSAGSSSFRRFPPSMTSPIASPATSRPASSTRPGARLMMRGARSWRRGPPASRSRWATTADRPVRAPTSSSGWPSRASAPPRRSGPRPQAPRPRSVWPTTAARSKRAWGPTSSSSMATRWRIPRSCSIQHASCSSCRTAGSSPGRGPGDRGDPRVTDARPLREGELLWEPSPEFADASVLTAYRAWLERERGLTFADYGALWRWSVDDLEAFWTSIVAFFDLPVRGSWSRVLGRCRDARRDLVRGRGDQLCGGGLPAGHGRPAGARLPVRAASAPRWSSGTSSNGRSRPRRPGCAGSAWVAVTESSPSSRTSPRRSSPCWRAPASGRSGRAARPTSGRAA